MHDTLEMLSVGTDSFETGLGAGAPLLGCSQTLLLAHVAVELLDVGRAAGSTVVTALGCHVGVVDIGFLQKSFPKAMFTLGPLAIHTEF